MFSYNLFVLSPAQDQSKQGPVPDWHLCHYGVERPAQEQTQVATQVPHHGLVAGSKPPCLLTPGTTEP